MNPQTPSQPNPPIQPVPQQPAPGPGQHSGYTPRSEQDAPALQYGYSDPLASAMHYQTPQQPQAPPQAYATPAAVPVAGVPTPPQAAAPVVKTNPNSTQNMLQIAEIRDGIAIMNDGTFRAVVMVKSVNFDLMSPQEQEAVEYAYQGFLNSLYFPIQIFMRSQRVDLQPYINKLDKIRTEHDNMLLAMLMEDYINYIDELSQQTNIMDKRFYVVIPYFPTTDTEKIFSQSKNFLGGLADLFNSKEQHITINEPVLESAKTELRNRVQAVLAGLMQCGVQGLPLDTQELIELYYDTYNPDTATRQQLKNFDNLTADIITKGQGVAPQAHLQRELQ